MVDDNQQPEIVHEEVPGHRLVERIKQLIAEGNAHTLRIKTDDSRIFLEIPLTPAAFAGGVAMIASPWLVVLATVAGLVARVTIQIVKREQADTGQGDLAVQPPSAGL